MVIEIVFLFIFAFLVYKDQYEECHHCGSVEFKESYHVVVANANHLGHSDVNIV